MTTCLRGDHKYRLVAGAHRLAACKLAGQAEIEAFVVSGTEVELRRAEILENLARNELSALERAQFLAELKRLFQEANPDAKHGGNRTKKQDAKLASWYADVVLRSERGLRTIKRDTAIGARLSHAAAEMMRGTDFEDNQRELEALSKLEPATQKKVAAILTDSKNPAPSVAFARKIVEGHTAPNLSLEEKQFQILVKAWERTNQKARTQFKKHIEDHG